MRELPLVVGWTRAPVMHRPRRAPAAWTCLACDDVWPCIWAREELAREFDAIELGVLMQSWAIEAANDLRLPAGALFDRFIGWTRRLPAAGDRQGQGLPRPPTTVPAPTDARPCHRAGGRAVRLA